MFLYLLDYSQKLHLRNQRFMDKKVKILRLQGNEPLPQLFTFPFHYTPHPLCVKAAAQVQQYLQTRSDWQQELQQGKMFGVLLVRTPENEIGFLAAFSGLLDGSNNHEYFVPPVYDFLQPDSFFKVEEANISALNSKIEQLEQDERLQQMKIHCEELERKKEEAIMSFKKEMKAAKTERDRQRSLRQLSADEEKAFLHESQFQKAEMKRIKQSWEKLLTSAEKELNDYIAHIESLKEERKTRSAALQKQLFEHFCMLNAKGEKKDLCQIFANTPQRIPPAGSGECAAPKLLQYAYLHQLVPLAMAEFWWGNSPKTVIRRHGYYYPSCKSKCEPILKHMLIGLQVEPNPLLKSTHEADELETIYEDEMLLVVNKPAGMLSVPGLTGQRSVYDYIKKKYPEAEGPLIVHRLDMDTSGLLLIAKNKETHQALQEQFEQRTIKKRYIALLEGDISSFPAKGFIRLPLCADYEHRPMQKVDYETGKTAVTRYEIIGKEPIEQKGKTILCTRIAFYPITGRTHQLRVHAAHSDGLNTPILGDPLYGLQAERLYLHAEYLEFKHPANQQIKRITQPAPF